MYWTDARENHGTGRRAIQPADNMRGLLRGGPVDQGSCDTPVRRKAPGACAMRDDEAGRDLLRPPSICCSPDKERTGVFTPLARNERGAAGKETRVNYSEQRELFPEEKNMQEQCRRRVDDQPASGDRTPCGNNVGFRSPYAFADEQPLPVFDAPLHDPRGSQEDDVVDGKRGHLMAAGADAEVDDGYTYDGSVHGVINGSPGRELQDHCGRSSGDRHGRGRQYFHVQDGHVTRADHEAGEEKKQGRRSFAVQDNLKSEVMKPVEDMKSPRKPRSAEVKEQIKDWLLEEHSLAVTDESRWAEAELTQHGLNWKLQAFSERRHCIYREAASAKAVAAKFAMMPTPELRCFGLRFASGKELALLKQKRREKRCDVVEGNPSLNSSGMHNVMGKEAGNELFSNRKKHPEDMMRRYISSGKDHFDAAEVTEDDAPGSHGHIKDRSFLNGLPRGIGHGKRFIGTKDQLFGANITGDDPSNSR